MNAKFVGPAVFAGGILFAACAGESGPASDPTVTIQLGALASTAGAHYSIQVDTWQNGNWVSFDQLAPETNGNAMTFVGTCRAGAQARVTVTLDSAKDAEGNELVGVCEGETVEVRTFECVDGQDHRVAADFHLMCDVERGFIDFAFNTDEVYCQTKIDCPADPFLMVDGVRVQSLIIGATCTLDPYAEDVSGFAVDVRQIWRCVDVAGQQYDPTTQPGWTLSHYSGSEDFQALSYQNYAVAITPEALAHHVTLEDGTVVSVPAVGCSVDVIARPQPLVDGAVPTTDTANAAVVHMHKDFKISDMAFCGETKSEVVTLDRLFVRGANNVLSATDRPADAAGIAGLQGLFASFSFPIAGDQDALRDSGCVADNYGNVAATVESFYADYAVDVSTKASLAAAQTEYANATSRFQTWSAQIDLEAKAVAETKASAEQLSIATSQFAADLAQDSASTDACRFASVAAQLADVASQLDNGERAANLTDELGRIASYVDNVRSYFASLRTQANALDANLAGSYAAAGEGLTALASTVREAQAMAGNASEATFLAALDGITNSCSAAGDLVLGANTSGGLAAAASQFLSDIQARADQIANKIEAETAAYQAYAIDMEMTFENYAQALNELAASLKDLRDQIAQVQKSVQEKCWTQPGYITCDGEFYWWDDPTATMTDENFFGCKPHIFTVDGVKDTFHALGECTNLDGTIDQGWRTNSDYFFSTHLANGSAIESNGRLLAWNTVAQKSCLGPLFTLAGQTSANSITQAPQ